MLSTAFTLTITGAYLLSQIGRIPEGAGSSLLDNSDLAPDPLMVLFEAAVIGNTFDGLLLEACGWTTVSEICLSRGQRRVRLERTWMRCSRQGGLGRYGCRVA